MTLSARPSPRPYHAPVELASPAAEDDWVALVETPLPVADALAWATGPAWGAQVVFTGTVRDHAEGRDGVTALEYEAYVEHAEERMRAVVGEVRARWPEIGRVALLHRVGRLELSEVAVVVVVSSPHRADAFAAARFAIDTLKATVPIWKKEFWQDGAAWGTGATPVAEVGGKR